MHLANPVLVHFFMEVFLPMFLSFVLGEGLTGTLQELAAFRKTSLLEGSTGALQEFAAFRVTLHLSALIRIVLSHGRDSRKERQRVQKTIQFDLIQFPRFDHLLEFNHVTVQNKVSIK